MIKLCLTKQSSIINSISPGSFHSPLPCSLHICVGFGDEGVDDFWKVLFCLLHPCPLCISVLAQLSRWDREVGNHENLSPGACEKPNREVMRSSLCFSILGSQLTRACCGLGRPNSVISIRGESGHSLATTLMQLDSPCVRSVLNTSFVHLLCYFHPLSLFLAERSREVVYIILTRPEISSISLH